MKIKGKEQPVNVITNCNFTNGVYYDAKAIESINLVARGLLNLTELFKAQKIEIPAMISINTEESK